LSVPTERNLSTPHAFSDRSAIYITSITKPWFFQDFSVERTYIELYSDVSTKFEPALERRSDMTFILRKEVANNAREIVTEHQFMTLIKSKVVSNVQFSANWAVRVWFTDYTSLLVHSEGSAYMTYVDYLDGSNFARDMQSLTKAVENAKKSR
jgi:hypothetical protein